jgi:hypothetical protein
MLIYKGSTFSRFATCKNRGKPTNLTGYTITAKIKFSTNLSVDIPCMILDQTTNPGKFIFGPIETDDWPTGTYSLIIIKTYQGVEDYAKIDVDIEEL